MNLVKFLILFFSMGVLTTIAQAQVILDASENMLIHSNDQRLFAISHKQLIFSEDFKPGRDSCYELIVKTTQRNSAFYIGLAFETNSDGVLQLTNLSNNQLLEPLVHINKNKTHSWLSRTLDVDSVLVKVCFQNQTAPNITLGKFYVEHSLPNLDDDRFGLALPCHVNAACNEANPYEEMRRSTCRIVMAHEEGLGYCSGTLVNNTAADGTPYILSAFHCPYFLTPIYTLWRFDFHFKSPACENPPEAPSFLSFYGCDYVAGRLESDFLLLRMHENVSPGHGLFFSGWNYSPDSIPASGFMFHHPRGDIMKFSADSDPLELIRTIINWGMGVITPPNHHIRANWDLGTMEKGSSGAGVWNAEKHLVGQLHGGAANCETLFRSNFGRFAMSWNQGDHAETRLVDWLDPLQLEPVKWDGMYLVDTQSFSLTWTVHTPDGVGLDNLYQEIQWPDHIQFIESGNGMYQTNGWKADDEFQFTTFKSDFEMNGISSIDLHLLYEHITLIQLITDPFSLLAADIDQNGNNRPERSPLLKSCVTTKGSRFKTFSMVFYAGYH
jgi:hypothetical protein